MFISYVRNPFLISPQRSKSQNVIQTEEQIFNNNTIIDEINQINAKRINREVESKELE